MGCQQADQFRCVIEDEASAVLARMPEQAVIVFATPVYFMGFSAQMKLLIDRMFSLFKIRADGYSIAPGLDTTSLALIASAGGDEESGLKLVEENMRAIAAFIKQVPTCLLFPSAPLDIGALTSDRVAEARAVAFGKELVQ